MSQQILSCFLGDVQPYVALGKELKHFGHRVRLATHEAFRSFVTDEGLEFFCIGGDPKDLMSYMVKSEHQWASNLLFLTMPFRPRLNAWFRITHKWRYWKEEKNDRRGTNPYLGSTAR